MRKKLISFAAHPLFLSCLVTLVIVLLFFPDIPRYRLIQDDLIIEKNTLALLYDDLDGNGYSDRIIASDYAYDKDIASLFIYLNPSKHFQEWDFSGSFDFWYSCYLFTGDYNSDGMKEVYVFTLSNDSVHLCIVSDFTNKNPVYERRFITTYVPWNNKPDLTIDCSRMHDMDRDGFKDLVFSINGGYSGLPRNAFIYNIHLDTLLISPPNGYFLGYLHIFDITGDGISEVFPHGYAMQSFPDTVNYPINDRYCWLIAFDSKLNYLFKPYKFPYYGYSGLRTFCLPNGKGFHDLYALYVPPVQTGKPSVFYHYSCNGSAIDSCSVPYFKYDQIWAVFTLPQGTDPTIVASEKNGQVYHFDTTLKEIKRRFTRNTHFYPVDTLDIDLDDKKEIISFDGIRGVLSVFRADLSNPVFFQMPLQRYGMMTCSLKKVPDQYPQLSAYVDGYEFLLSYSENPLYYVRWPIFIGIFLVVWLFILLIRKIQRTQIEKRHRTEKKITELQLKIVKNQMDPHFSMNAINSVIAAVQRNEKEQAGQSLLHFSKMYRSLVLSGDKIQRSLAEELEFSRNYLELEKFRFKDRFDFRIDIDEQMDLNTPIPKMIIQSPVENAIKHGLLKKESGGLLIIRAVSRDSVLVLEIEDNGIGRTEAGKDETQGTGKGLQIMEEFLELYHKITGIRIQWRVIDLFDDAGKATGTKVEITIPVEKS